MKLATPFALSSSTPQISKSSREIDKYTISRSVSWLKLLNARPHSLRVFISLFLYRWVTTCFSDPPAFTNDPATPKLFFEVAELENEPVS